MNIQTLAIATIAAPSAVRTQNGFDEASIRQLAASIEAQGLMQPIVVRPASVTDDEADLSQTWITVAGRRRLAACKLLGWTEIPAVIYDDDEGKAYVAEVTENLQREDMTLADTARAVRTLMAVYDSAATVAKLLSKSPAWISKHLAVTSSKFPVELKDLMDSNTVSDLETLHLLKQINDMGKNNAEAAAKFQRLLTIARQGNLSRPMARDALARLRAPATPPAQPAVSTRIVQRSAAVSETPATDAIDPATAFTIALPIELLALVEEKGGSDWIIGLIKANSES